MCSTAFVRSADGPRAYLNERHLGPPTPRCARTRKRNLIEPEANSQAKSRGPMARKKPPEIR
jgi:hypothetical protein